MPSSAPEERIVQDFIRAQVSGAHPLTISESEYDNARLQQQRQQEAFKQARLEQRLKQQEAQLNQQQEAQLN